MNAFTEADGRQLAADMLREIGARWLEGQGGLDANDRSINEQIINREPGALRRYLATVRDSGSEALERGFLCVLTDFIGSSVTEGVPDVALYEEDGHAHGF